MGCLKEERTVILFPNQVLPIQYSPAECSLIRELLGKFSTLGSEVYCHFHKELLNICHGCLKGIFEERLMSMEFEMQI